MPFFVGADRRQFVLAQLPAGVPLSAALAAATTRLLLGDGAPCLPLAPLFECDPGALCQVASVITGTGGARSASQLEGGQGVLAPDLQSSAGQLGAPLTPIDASALHLRPLRPYAAGELVAYQGAGQRQLHYGRVAADSRPPPGAPAYRITVEVEPSSFQDLLSSQLYSFGEECSAGPPGTAGGQPADVAALPGASHLLHSPEPSSVLHQQQAQPRQPSGTGMAQSQPQQASLLGSVPAAELVAAAHSMLSMAGVPVSANQAELAAEIAQLQQQLQQSQQQLVKANEVGCRCLPCLPLFTRTVKGNLQPLSSLSSSASCGGKVAERRMFCVGCRSGGSLRTRRTACAPPGSAASASRTRWTRQWPAAATCYAMPALLLCRGRTHAPFAAGRARWSASSSNSWHSWGFDELFSYYSTIG